MEAASAKARQRASSRAKVRAAEDGTRDATGSSQFLKERVLNGGSLAGVTREELQGIERMIDEQETLINAYQQDNERMAVELRAAKVRVKELEAQVEAPLANGAAAGELGDPWLSPSARHRVVSSTLGGDGGSTVAELQRALEDTREAGRRREIELKQELDRLRIAKKEGEARFEGVNIVSLEHDSKELQQAELETKAELAHLKQKHRQEIDASDKQLRWYIENQEIVDKNDVELKEQRNKIAALEQQVKELSDISGGGKPRHAGAAARTIKELETQVGMLRAELDDVIKKKHPNSVASLIRAARQPVEETAAHAYLQQRANQLEQTLHTREEAHAKSLRALRQGFERIRSQNEGRLAALEAELKDKSRQLEGNEKPHLKIKEMERQLDDTRAYYTKRLRALSGKMTNEPKKDSEAEQAAAKLITKLKRLETELGEKNMEVRELKTRLEEGRDEVLKAQRDTPVRRSSLGRGAGAGENRPSTPHKAAGGGEMEILRDNWMGISPLSPPMELPTDPTGSMSYALQGDMLSQQTLLKIKEQELETCQRRLAEADAIVWREKLATEQLQAQLRTGGSTPAALRCRELETQVTIIVQRYVPASSVDLYERRVVAHAPRYMHRYEAREREMRSHMQRTHHSLEVELTGAREELGRSALRMFSCSTGI
jgi:hypothetical protein